jgi:hypothetical protein
MGGWWTSATTLAVAAGLLWDVSRAPGSITAEVLRRQYGPVAGRVARILARYERAAGSWQYANSNVNLQLYRAVGLAERPPAGLAAFDQRLLRELQACRSGLDDLRDAVAWAGARRELGRLSDALAYVHVQRQVVAADLEANAAVRASLPGARDAAAERLRTAAQALARARRWAARAAQLGRRGSRQGTAWDRGSPDASEAIASVRYAW